MTAQLELFGRARSTDPQSSRDAARRARPGQYDAGIFDLLERYRTMTKNQICGHLNLPDAKAWGTVSARLSHLRQAGRLEWAGETPEGNLYRIASTTVETGDRL